MSKLLDVFFLLITDTAVVSKKENINITFVGSSFADCEGGTIERGGTLGILNAATLTILNCCAVKCSTQALSNTVQDGQFLYSNVKNISLDQISTLFSSWKLENDLNSCCFVVRNSDLSTMKNINFSNNRCYNHPSFYLENVASVLVEYMLHINNHFNIFALGIHASLLELKYSVIDGNMGMSVFAQIAYCGGSQNAHFSDCYISGSSNFGTSSLIQFSRCLLKTKDSNQIFSDGTYAGIENVTIIPKFICMNKIDFNYSVKHLIQRIQLILSFLFIINI